MPRRKPPVIADSLLDQLLAGADAKTAFDTDGLLDQLKKALGDCQEFRVRAGIVGCVWTPPRVQAVFRGASGVWSGR